jgi:peptidoglycan/LPS O-acetylase OafA/YrhL
MKRIEALTFLRFFAAFTLVTYHLGQQATGPFGSFALQFGVRLLSFFFTLSGFVLTISYFDKPGFETRQFYVARLSRVAPLYLLALALTVPFVFGNGIHNLTGLLLSATFLQAWVHPYNISFNDPAWAVSVEIFLYLLFPMILGWIHKRNVTPKAMLVLALATYLVTQVILTVFVNLPFFQPFPSWTYSLVYFFPLAHICSFLLGMAGGMLYLRNRERIMVNTALSYVVVIGAFVLDYVAIQYADRLSPILGIDLPTYSSFHSLTQLALILAIAFTDNGITRFLSWKPFAVLGGASYAVYLLQRPIWLMQKFALKRLHLSHIPPTPAFLLLCFVLLAVSLLSYYFFEPAARKWVLQIDDWAKRAFGKRAAPHND